MRAGEHRPGGRPGHGYRVAREGFREGATNRVVLLSDGLANVGATDATSILERVREQAERQIGLLDRCTVAGYRLVGYDDRRLASEDFRDDRADGGEVLAGHSVTALYLVRLRDGADGPVAHTQLRWQDPGTREPRESGAGVGVADLGASLAQSAPRLQVDYAAAFLAEQLRGSREGAQVSPGYLARLTDAAADCTEDADVRELAELIRPAGA